VVAVAVVAQLLQVAHAGRPATIEHRSHEDSPP